MSPKSKVPSILFAAGPTTELEIIYRGHHHLLLVVGRGCVRIDQADPSPLLLHQQQLVLVQRDHAVPLVGQARVQITQMGRHLQMWTLLLLLVMVLLRMVAVMVVSIVVVVLLLLLLLLMVDGRMNHRMMMIVIVLQSGVSIMIGIRLRDAGRCCTARRTRCSIIVIMPIVVAAAAVAVRRMPRRSSSSRRRVIFRDDRRIRRLLLGGCLRWWWRRTVMLGDWNGYGRRQIRSEIQEAHRNAHQAILQGASAAEWERQRRRGRGEYK